MSSIPMMDEPFPLHDTRWGHVAQAVLAAPNEKARTESVVRLLALGEGGGFSAAQVMASIDEAVAERRNAASVAYGAPAWGQRVPIVTPPPAPEPPEPAAIAVPVDPAPPPPPPAPRPAAPAPRRAPEPPQWFDENAPPVEAPRKDTGKAPRQSHLAVELPRSIDIQQLARNRPSAPREIAPGLTEGEVALWGGHGGTGKSGIALQKAVCIAAGRHFFGVAVKQRRVAYFSMEDGADILHWRLANICAWLNVDMASLAGKLDLIDATSCGPLMDEADGRLRTTAIYDWVREHMDGQQVLILDGASDAFAGREINRAHVKAFIRSLRRLIPADGAVLLLAHVDKATARNGDTTEGYSGSTAWSNSCRARWFLRREEGGDLILELQKSNHSPIGTQFAIRWNDTAKCFVGELVVPAGRMERELLAVDARDTLVKIIAELAAAGNPCPTATAGPRTAYHVLSVHPEFPACFAGKGKGQLFRDAIEALIQAGRIKVGQENTASRNKRPVFLAALVA